MLLGTKDFPRSLQRDDYSCGARSAYMIAKFFGLGLHYREVKEALGTDENGTNVEPMRRLFRRHGLHVERRTAATIVDLENALDRGGVILLYVDGDHYAVLHGLSRRHAWVADPSVIRQLGRRISRRRFRRRWCRWGLIVRE